MVDEREDDEPGVRRPARRHGFTREIRNLAQIAACGLHSADLSVECAALADEAERGAEEGTVAHEHFEKVGAEAVGHFRKIAGVNVRVFLAEETLSRAGFEGAHLNGLGAAVAAGPERGDDNIGTSGLEAAEVGCRRLYAAEYGAPGNGIGISEAHEGQETEVGVDDLLQFGAISSCLGIGAGKRGGKAKADGVLAGTVNVDAGSGVCGLRRAQDESQQEDEKKLP